MNCFQVFSASINEEQKDWLDYWNVWPTREIFAYPDYVSLFLGRGDRAMCAVFDSTQGQVIFPFVLRSLRSLDWFTGSEDTYDLTSPYGYGGAYAIGNPDSDLFWIKFDEWAEENNIISIFTRLSLFPDQLIPFKGNIEVKSQNIIRELSLEPDGMWMDYAHKVRKNVKKARRNGLEVQIDLDGLHLQEFLGIYYSTMERRNAAGCYYFPEEFFHNIVRDLAGQFAFFHTLYENEIVSTELVLVSANYLYSFLGGTLSKVYPLRPNDLLKHEIIEWGREQGKRAFVLGGGYEDGDGICRYKQSFAPHGVVPFKVGKRIYDSRIYEKLIEQRLQWEKNQGRDWKPRPDFFPAYRS